MLPKFLQLWEQMRINNKLIFVLADGYKPSSLASLFALYQKECSRVGNTVYYAINLEGRHRIDIITYTKKQHLKDFLKYRDKFAILLFNPEESLEPYKNADVTALLDEQFVATDSDLGEVRRIRSYVDTSDFSGIVTPKGNHAYISKKANMCFRSQIFI